MVSSAPRRLAAHPATLWLIKNIISPIDRTVVTAGRGRLPLPTSLFFPTLLLTTVGRRSGKPRTVPLIYVRDGDSYVVANARPQGERKNPWVLNLLNASEVTIQVRTSTIHAGVVLLDEHEADRLWPGIVAGWPALETFYRATGDRWVFRLDRLSPDESE